jgi:hypothetical protein
MLQKQLEILAPIELKYKGKIGSLTVAVTISKGEFFIPYNSA